MSARPHVQSRGVESSASDWPHNSEMAARIRAFDWSSTPLGPLTTWPDSLRTKVALCLHSRFQLAIYWGPELNFIYNDAESRVIGDLHPRALGMPARELLRDMWGVVGPQLSAVMDRGEATWAEDQPLPFNRRGFVETVYFTYSYSPIPDGCGGTGGVLLVTKETTARVLAERRLEVLRAVSLRSMDALGRREACTLAARGLHGVPELESVLIYLIDGSGSMAVCVATSNATALAQPLEVSVDMGGSGRLPALFRELAANPGQSRLLDGGAVFRSKSGAPPPSQAIAVSVNRGASDAVDGFLVAGIGNALAPDSERQCRSFVEMIAMAVGRSVAAGRAREEERARVHDLASAERAKAAGLEEQYRRIFEATTDAMVITDLDTGLITEVNPAACRMLGYEYDELIGMNPLTWIHPDYHHLYYEYLDTVSAGREFRARSQQVRKDGSIYHVDVSGGAFLFQGRPHRLAVMRDISNEIDATRLLEQRVAERTDELANLLSFANRAASIRELGQLATVVLPEVEHMLACSWSGVYLKDGNALVAVDGESSAPLRLPLPDNWSELRADQTVPGADSLEALFPRGVSSARALVVPLAAGGEPLGILCLARGVGQPFGEEQRSLARGVGDQLGVAISNIRYAEASQQAAALEERHRIARDLHDSVSQSLFSLTLHARSAELALGRAGVGANSELARPLRRVSNLTRAALAEMRALIFELRPGALAQEGLGAALAKHSAAVSAREGVAITVTVPSSRVRLTSDQEEHLYRLAQEALHNVVKHARADHAWVELAARESDVVLAVRDDGVGFDPDDARPGHLGLETMRDRAAQIGGELTVDSRAGGGTTVQVRIPTPP